MSYADNGNTHTDHPLKCDFRNQGPSKHVNPSESPLDGKTILFLPYMDKRKLKKRLIFIIGSKVERQF